MFVWLSFQTVEATLAVLGLTSYVTHD